MEQSIHIIVYMPVTNTHVKENRKTEVEASVFTLWFSCSQTFLHYLALQYFDSLVHLMLVIPETLLNYTVLFWVKYK